MTAALFWGPEARFAAGLALGLTLSVALFVAKGAERPAAARSVRLGTSGGRGRYDDIFARVEPLVAGIEELAVAWGNVGCAKGIYLDVGSNVVRTLHGLGSGGGVRVLSVRQGGGWGPGGLGA